MEKKEYYSNLFIGCSYKLENPTTIGHLKRNLQTIIDELPEDNLKIQDLQLNNGELYYLLEEGTL